MILKSLIQDESTLSIDCARTRMSKGSVIEIKDEFWTNAEIQGAIRLGLIELIGAIPEVQQEPEQEKEQNKLKFRNVSDTKIAFECIMGYDLDGKSNKWSDYVAPNEYILIPEVATYSRQVQNALGWGLIVPADEGVPFKRPVKSDPVELDELTIQDTIDEPEPNAARCAAVEPKADMKIESAPVPKRAAAEESPLVADDSNPFDAIFSNNIGDGGLPSSEDF
jgi:hypothetical protein